MAENNQKKFPKNHPPYRVFWNWELTHDCNYQCSYCSTWCDDVKTPRYLSASEWKDIWDMIFDKYYSCVVRFSGGEPSIYPQFIDIVKFIADKHSVDITTNLSFNIYNFARKVKPGNVAISASFHPEFIEIREFLNKVLFLHQNGFISTICYVTYPPYLRKLQYYKTIVEEHDIMFKFLPFTGECDGKSYPQDYTDEERCLMEGTAHAAKDPAAKKLNTQWYDWNTLKRETSEGCKQGKLCRMGQMYAVIHTDGSVSRCCAVNSKIMGNIFDEDFKLLEEPGPCSVEHCPCFKAMIAGEEENWCSLWEGLPHKKYK